MVHNSKDAEPFFSVPILSYLIHSSHVSFPTLQASPQTTLVVTSHCAASSGLACQHLLS